MLSYSDDSRFAIGVDVGTQSIKAALWSSEGKLCAAAVKNTEITQSNGRIEQELSQIVSTVCEVVYQVAKNVDPAKICGLGIDAQMAGLVGIDADFLPVGAYDSWLDSRCSKCFSMIDDDNLRKKSGGQTMVAHAPKILYQKLFEKERYLRTEKYIPLNTYITGKLCGLRADEAYYDDTHLHFNLFSDNAKRTWNREAIVKYGLDPEKFPDICSPIKTMGYIAGKLSESLHIGEGAIIIAGLGDTAASAFGAGILHEGMVYDVAGTASVFAASTNEFQPDIKEKTILFSRSSIKDMYLPLAYIGGGGLCISWFRRIFGGDYKKIEHLAKQALPGCGGLLFNPHFTGRTCPSNENCVGEFYGLTWEHTAGDLYRSILESIAYEYKNYYRILSENFNYQGKAIYGTGGGTASDLFCQIKADVLGLPYIKIEVKESATLACAALVFETAKICEAKRIVSLAVSHGKIFEPDIRNKEIYEAMGNKYAEHMKSFMIGREEVN